MITLRSSIARSRPRPWHLVALVATVYVALTLLRYGGDPVQFAHVGTYFDPGVPGGTKGYDGQFAYQIARDPLGAARFLDKPASYRYQRILYPLLARALALGQVWLAPWTLILINWLALVAGAWFTEEILAGQGLSRWYALSYGLFGGLIMGVRLDLTEPLAYGLVQAALWSYGRGRLRRAAGLLALAALTKETTLVTAAGFLLSLALSRRWRDLVEWGAIVGLPFAVLQGVLWLTLGAPGIGSGGDMATPFEIIPYRGLWSIALVKGVSLAAFGLIGVIAATVALIPGLAALVASARDLIRRDWHPAVCILFMNALVLPFTPQSTVREPLGILRFAAGLVAAILIWGAYRKSRRALNYSLFWIATLAFVRE